MKHHRMTLVGLALSKASRSWSAWLVLGILTVSLANALWHNGALAESPFHTPSPKVVKSSSPPVPVKQPSYQIGGVVVTKARQVVALRVDGKPWRVLMTGDRLPGGGVIRHIHLDNVVLHRRGQMISLEVPR